MNERPTLYILKLGEHRPGKDGISRQALHNMADICDEFGLSFAEVREVPRRRFFHDMKYEVVLRCAPLAPGQPMDDMYATVCDLPRGEYIEFGAPMVIYKRRVYVGVEFPMWLKPDLEDERRGTLRWPRTRFRLLRVNTKGSLAWYLGLIYRAAWRLVGVPDERTRRAAAATARAAASSWAA